MRGFEFVINVFGQEEKKGYKVFCEKSEKGNVKIDNSTR